MFKKIIWTLIAWFIPATVLAATVFVWTPPATNTDGTPVTDLGGYKIYCSSVSGIYNTATAVGLPLLNADGEVEYPISNILNTDITSIKYCTVTALDTNGNESERSNEVAVPLVGMAPGAPGAFRAK